ncbi:MAG TPA: YhdP family protein [Gammaproteobacteria bacterium]|nr:YhdP family protein [Gammaproteobacteria bacterium]
MKRWQRRIWKGIAALFAALVILLATVIGVFRLFAPLVPGYRAEVERWAEQALDRPVRIASMGARWDWYGPEITLDKVRLYSHDGKYVVMTAHEIRLGVSLRALLHGAFSAPSRIILMEPQLSVVRDAQGHYSVRGFDDAANRVRQLDWRSALDDAFRQRAEIMLRDASVTLLDMRQRATPFVFSGVDIRLDNAADSHRLSGRMQLPAAFGHTLAFDAGVEGTGLHPEAWQWHASISGQALEVPRMLSYWTQYKNRFADGVLDLHAEVAGSGARISTLKTHLSGHDLLPAGASAQGFTTLAGDVSWSRSDTGWELSGRDIVLAHGGQRWPASHFDLAYRADAQSDAWQGDASFLRMQDIDTLMSWLPPAWLDKLQSLQKLAPQGDISDLRVAARWQGATPGAWSVHGRFRDLGIRADDKIPGFSGMDGELALNQAGGTLTLNTRDASLVFPHLFRGPLYAGVLDAGFRFTHDAAGWRIASDDIRVKNADGNATGKGSFLFPADGSSPRLDLDATVTDADARNKSAYFPVGIMPKEVVAWLDSAIVSGQVPQATLSVHGRLADFPYDNGKGLFDIRFRVIHAVLDYASGWPGLQNLDADVEFRNQGLSAVVRSGNILGDDIAGAKAGFADLRTGVLRVDGGARGSAQAALDFLRSGPLKRRFGNYLDGVQASGRSDVTLHLVLPVDKPDDFRLDGNAHLRDVGVSVKAAPAWTLSQLWGDVHFTGIGISADAVRGVMFGAPVTIAAHPGSGADADTTLFEAHGSAEAAALMTAFALPVKDALSGRTDWVAHGRIPNDPAAGTAGLSLQLDSDLQGLGINLPAPLAKPAAASAPLTATLAILDGGTLRLGIGYAARAAAQLQFISRDSGWQFDRGTINVGEGAAALPETSGLSVTGRLDEFDTDAWQAYADAGFGDNNMDVPQLPAFLQHVDLHVEHFSGFGQAINGLHLLLDRDQSDWRIALASAAIGGHVSLPFTVDAQHPIIADMDHVNIEHERPATAPAADLPAARGYDPRRIPALRFSSKLLQFSGVSLTQVHAVLTPRADGINLADFTVDGRTFKAGASGNWTVQPDGVQRSHLSAHITSSDIEQTLKAFGYAPGITGDKGELQADIDWLGGPFADIVPSLDGKVHVKLANGQLLEVQPGAGRIFGLLSINALPRRLLLNFSDVFGKGFAYDSIEGNFTLQQGDAYTKDLTISGPAAKIHMLGRIGLARQDFDEALIVDASVGSTLPIIGALAGGVGVGAVVWLLTEVFKKPLTAVGEMRYHLTGSWDNPKLEKVAESPKTKLKVPAARTTSQPQVAPP